MDCPYDRRSFLCSGLAIGSVGLSGCISSDNEGDSGPTYTATTTPANSPDKSTPNEPTSDKDISDEKETEEESTDLSAGAVYIPFMGGPGDQSKWPDCAVGEPEVGQYSHEESDFEEKGRSATNSHIEQMQNHDISRVMFNFGEEAEDYERLRNFKSVEKFGEIEIECYYVISQAMRRERDFKQDFEFVRENFLTEDNYTTFDGRPVVQFWDVGYLTWGGNEQARQVKNRIEEEWGFGGFVDYIREELTVGGTDPFLVGDFHDLGQIYSEGNASEEMLEMFRKFDAASTWTGRNPYNETIEWEEALAHVESNFEGYRNLISEYNMEFIPTTFPGFDDRANECWGGDRHLPRDSERFRTVLNLANEYRTTEFINIATWNDWNEGHQIEPGSHMGEEYGTEYLEVVADFASTG